MKSPHAQGRGSMRQAVTLELLMRGGEMVRFLRFHREQAWSVWLERRLEDIRSGHPDALAELLEGFTGLANITDVFLCPEAGHRVAKSHERGVNEQYLVMLSKLYSLIRDAGDTPPSD